MYHLRGCSTLSYIPNTQEEKGQNSKLLKMGTLRDTAQLRAPVLEQHEAEGSHLSRESKGKRERERKKLVSLNKCHIRE